MRITTLHYFGSFVSFAVLVVRVPLAILKSNHGAKPKATSFWGAGVAQEV